VPAASLLLALWFRPLQGSPAGGRPLRLSAWLEALLLGLLAVAAALSPNWAASDPAHPQFGAVLQRSGLPTSLALILGLVSGALLLLLLRKHPGDRWLWLPSLAGFLLILASVVTPLAGLIDRERQRPLRQLAFEAQRLARPNEPLWVVGTKRYSMVFYAGETAAFVASRDGISERMGRDALGLGLGPASRSVRLVGDRRDLEALRLPPDQIEHLGRRDQQELWRVSLTAFALP
jgi:hypothetical protein